MGKRRTGKPLANNKSGFSPDKFEQAQQKFAGRGAFGQILSGVIGAMTGGKVIPQLRGMSSKPKPQSNLDEDKMDASWEPKKYGGSFTNPYSQARGRSSKGRRRSSYNW